jgi:hypothetical protein
LHRWGDRSIDGARLTQRRVRSEQVACQIQITFISTAKHAIRRDIGDAAHRRSYRQRRNIGKTRRPRLRVDRRNCRPPTRLPPDCRRLRVQHGSPQRNIRTLATIVHNHPPTGSARCDERALPRADRMQARGESCTHRPGNSAGPNRLNTTIHCNACISSPACLQRHVSARFPACDPARDPTFFAR